MSMSIGIPRPTLLAWLPPRPIKIQESVMSESTLEPVPQNKSNPFYAQQGATLSVHARVPAFILIVN
jgi:hypothetical protein